MEIMILFSFKDDNQNNDIVKINQSIQVKSSNVQ